MTAGDRWHGFIHFLYEPALLGKKCVAVPDWRRPFHRIHLIPGSWLERSCNRYDAYLEGKE